MAYYTMLWKDEKSKISDLLDCIECRKIRLDEFGRPDGFQIQKKRQFGTLCTKFEIEGSNLQVVEHTHSIRAGTKYCVTAIILQRLRSMAKK